MLENDPIKQLNQNAQSLSVAQTEIIEPIVHERRSNLTITRPNDSRIDLPISTIQSSAAQIGGSRTLMPRIGYDLLDDMPSIHIEQSYELNENLTISSENRYIIRSSLGEALFAATESSTARDRMLWGDCRPFQMHVLDKTHQEALTFRRKNSYGLFFCQQRCLEVWSPPGDFLGEIVEESSLIASDFLVRDCVGNVIYKIKSLTNRGYSCCLPKEGHFEIVTPDLQSSKGSISRKWSSSLSQYTINIYFTDIMETKSKALILGAGFILEYLCFQ